MTPEELDTLQRERDLSHKRWEEIAALRAALRNARTATRDAGQYTLRQFAAICRVTPTQLSAWTADTTDAPPDLID